MEHFDSHHLQSERPSVYFIKNEGRHFTAVAINRYRVIGWNVQPTSMKMSINVSFTMSGTKLLQGRVHASRTGLLYVMHAGAKLQLFTFSFSMRGKRSQLGKLVKKHHTWTIKKINTLPFFASSFSVVCCTNKSSREQRPPPPVNRDAN